eukprot:1162136-Pelagomonas_calceolata.AAC.5
MHLHTSHELPAGSIPVMDHDRSKMDHHASHPFMAHLDSLQRGERLPESSAVSAQASWYAERPPEHPPPQPLALCDQSLRCFLYHGASYTPLVSEPPATRAGYPPGALSHQHHGVSCNSSGA